MVLTGARYFLFHYCLMSLFLGVPQLLRDALSATTLALYAGNMRTESEIVPHAHSKTPLRYQISKGSVFCGFRKSSLKLSPKGRATYRTEVFVNGMPT